MDHIHMIGIGGSGMSAIGRVLLESGYEISGSDRELNPLAANLQKAGARIFVGHHARNITGANLVIRSSAIPDTNPEVEAALAAGIPVLKRADFLGQLISKDNRQSIAICGTHGKTTTTAMISWMLSSLRMDPSFIIGGVSKNLNANAHSGKGSYFVIEADEYDRMFLGLTPNYIVVTNIEHDHPDCYPTLQDYQKAFYNFISNLQPDGMVFACKDDPGSSELIRRIKERGIRVFSYGIEPDPEADHEPLPAVQSGFQVDYLAKKIKKNNLGCFDFEVWRLATGETPVFLVTLSLQVPGIHNIRNSLAAVAIAHSIGLSLADVAESMHTFTGTGRRFEIVGEVNGITLIDDYAHHPTEIRTTLAAARSRFPFRKLWVVWQPHTFSRTRTLQNEFSTAFVDADEVILTSIYGARESSDLASMEELVSNLKNSISGPPVHYIPDFSAIVQFLFSQLKPGDVLLVLSAGDANQVNTLLLDELRK
jgi:UDP-N-acetylmuramate--alanine ligase